jgi:plastocyanin
MSFRTLVAIPFIALSFAACSSDGGSGSSAATTPANATVVKAIEGIAWDAKSYDATAVDGKVTISIVNQSSLPHNLHLIDSKSVDVGISLKVEGQGDTDSATVALPAGTYQVICTIAGHGNMKATLTVK